MYFEELLKKLSPTLKRITHKLNGHFSFFNEEDLFQEALVYLWVAYEKGGVADKTTSYILQGCYFHMRNYIRKVQDKSRLISLDAVSKEEDADSKWSLDLKSDSSLFENIENRLLIEQIQNNGLAKREKEVLSLYCQGLTIREIGKRFDISHVMVLKLKNRIISRYRKLIEGEEA